MSQLPTEEQRAEHVNDVVVNIINSIIERHTAGSNLNVDLTAIATGLGCGRIARMAGVTDVNEVYEIIASNAPDEMNDMREWHWPEELPLQEEIFATETAALQDAENDAIPQMKENGVDPLHVALSLGMYAVHLADHAREHVEPHSVLGVFKEACERGYQSFLPN